MPDDYQDKTVVGVTFEGRPAILRELGKDAQSISNGWKIKKVNCTLVATKENKYDPFAIEIWIDDHHVGFVPKDHKAIHSHILLLHPDGLRMAAAIFLKGAFNPTVKLNTLAWFQLRRQCGDLTQPRL